MATVHFGRLIGGAGFSRTVAIKRLHPHLADDPAFCASIIDEARLAARIHHPNVVQTLDVVAHEKELLLVMEYVRGESLAQAMQAVVSRGARVPVPIVSAIAIGALSGLHAAHEATSDQGKPLGIVHRDVSPQNILVGVDGLARLIDFGVAKAAGRLQTTQDGMVKGKFAYMAPEQLAARHVTRTADVYAMGVVLWEMLACRRLIDGEDEAALMGSLLAGAKEPPSRYAEGLPPGLDAVVMKALAAESAERFSTALEMADELARVVAPALPAEVSAWCVDIARESLAKRATAVAEIESNGASASPLPRGDAEAAPSPGPGSEAARTPGTDPGPDDEVSPTIASQPSSLPLGTPPPVHVVPRRSFALGAVAILLVLGGAISVRWGRSGVASPAPEPPATPVSTGTTDTNDVPVELTESGAPPPPMTASTTTAPPSAPSHPGPAASGRGSAPSPRASTACSPPYVFDAHGNKKWKRQCL